MEHHADKAKAPKTNPAHDEVAKKAYDFYLKESLPQGHDVQNWLEAEKMTLHAGHDHHDHHAHMAADFRRRFWISLVVTLPILVLSPLPPTSARGF